MLGSRKLTLSVFQTVVAEAEAILNSRPLTHVSCSISDEGPLTPNHFLLRRPYMCLKPLVNSSQRFSTKDFKLTQTLLDHYWSRLLKEYIPELNKRTKWQRSNDEQLDEGDIVWVLKDFTLRGIWPLGRIAKAHRASVGIARSFDIQTSTEMVQRPAVTLSRVFPQLSSAREGHKNKFIETHTHTNKLKKLNIKKKFCALFYCLHFHFKCCLFCAGSVKKPSSFIFYLPPHPHFPPPTYTFVLQNPFIS